MREYQVKRNNPFWLPKAVYYQALYAVRDYDRLCEEYRDILNSSAPCADGQPRSSKIGNPTEQKAERLSEVSEKLDAIERALNKLPEEYRKGVFDNIRKNTAYPYIAGRATWVRYRRRFLYYVAHNLHLF